MLMVKMFLISIHGSSGCYRDNLGICKESKSSNRIVRSCYERHIGIVDGTNHLN
jgi:hypothetical protein